MLQWLRKSTKSWFIILAIGAIVVVFIFWGVGSYQATQAQQAAEVNGTIISMQDFLHRYNTIVKQYQERTQGELTPELAKAMHLKELALGQLVEKALILQAAQQLGLRVSDAELQRQIASYPGFQKDGKFDQKRYFWLLSRNHLSPQDFEAIERQDMLIRKVVGEITSFAKVSDAEVQEFLRMATEAVAVNYVEVPPEKFLARQNPSAEAVARYYKENEKEFKLPERARVAYLLFRPKDFLDKVKLAPGAVEEYLKDHQDEFTRAAVIRVRQIKLTLPPKGTEALRRQVVAKAEKLLSQIKAGKDFATVARAESQDLASRGKGGELGEVRRGKHPPEWDKVAFGLKPDTMGVATTKKAIYLIKVEAIQKKEPIPGAAKQAEQRLKKEQAGKLAKDTAQQARADLSGSPMAQVGKKLGVTPQETPLLSMSTSIPGLGAQPGFNQAALALKPKEVSKVVGLKEGFAVLQGVEHQAAHLPPLEKIRAQVKAALAKKLAREEAAREAARLLKEARDGKPLKKVAAQAGLTVKDSSFFTLLGGFQGQRQAEALTGAAFQLSREHPYAAKPLWWQKAYYLLAFKARQRPDLDKAKKEKELLRARLLNDKRQMILASWLDGQRRRAKIEVFVKP